MIFELHPPRTADPLRIGATGRETVETLNRLGTPQFLCRTDPRRRACGVLRPSGLFVCAYFDADDLVGPAELEPPDDREGRFFESALIARPGYPTPPPRPPTPWETPVDDRELLRNKLRERLSL